MEEKMFGDGGMDNNSENENITVDERNSRNEDYIREFVEGTKNTDDGKDCRPA